MFKKVLIKDNNSMKVKDKEWDDKKYLVLIRQYKIDPLSKTI
jgi:ribosomal protein L25 (general stress protein Ctc)